MSQANWWALFENDQYIPAGYFAGQIGGYFSKAPTIYLLGLGWANGWVLFECAHYLPAGYELGKLFQNPQLTHNAPTGYIALRPQRYLVIVNIENGIISKEIYRKTH